MKHKENLQRRSRRLPVLHWSEFGAIETPEELFALITNPWRLEVWRRRRWEQAQARWFGALWNRQVSAERRKEVGHV